MNVRDRLAEALLDENGLRPTETALDVLVAVAAALDGTDADWAGVKPPGLRRYVADVKTVLTALVDNTPVTPR